MASSKLEAAAWVMEQMQRDPDINAVFRRAIAEGDFASLSEFVRDDPDHFMALYEACLDMVEQIPEHHLREGRS